MSSSLEIWFKKYIEQNQLFTTNDKLLLAFSGGIDSVVLAHLLLKNNYCFELAHCNFQLRGNESNQDEQFAYTFANQHQLIIHSQTFDTKEFAIENKITIQEAARVLRYQYFYNLAKQQKCTYILTAHHLDDNIETVFLNIIRGTGLKGLCGIPIQNNQIVRPLLFATREQIKQYALNNDLAWREDSSNQTDKYTRNYIRHHILPKIQEIQPDIHNIFIKNLQHFTTSYQLLEELVNEKMHAFVQKKEHTLLILIDELKKISQAKLLLYHYLQPFGFNLSQIQQILEQNHQNGKTFTTSNYKAYIYKPYLTIIKNHNSNILQPYYIIEKNTKELLEPMHLIFNQFAINKDFEIPRYKHVAFIDSAHLSFPLYIRKWKKGDFFYPLGMNQRKKISDFLIDQKIPIYEKENIWILENKGEIVWVIGYRIDDRYKVTPQTQNILNIEWIK
ncbi:MAG: tRNA lysidine(34) synthetase TilS [Bacteroidales bacterium]|nr:tRNA lysidine(34) synthetase TilS [Bacteroidales bacterium]